MNFRKKQTPFFYLRDSLLRSTGRPIFLNPLSAGRPGGPSLTRALAQVHRGSNFVLFLPSLPFLHPFFEDFIIFLGGSIIFSKVWFLISRVLAFFRRFIFFIGDFFTYFRRKTFFFVDFIFYLHTHIHSYIHTHTYIQIHTCAHTYIHTHIHTYRHTHTHAHTHARTHILVNEEFIANKWTFSNYLWLRQSQLLRLCSLI